MVHVWSYWKRRRKRRCTLKEEKAKEMHPRGREGKGDAPPGGEGKGEGSPRRRKV